MKLNSQPICVNANYAYPRICRDSLLKCWCKIVVQ